MQRVVQTAVQKVIVPEPTGVVAPNGVVEVTHTYITLERLNEGILPLLGG